MTTLDRRIIFYFTGQDVTGHAAGMYPYYLRRYPVTGITPEIIFAGNFYYNGSDTSITFDVTDIMESDGWVVKEDDFESVYSKNNKIANKYNLQIVWSSTDIITSSNQWVAKVSSYHNKNLSSYKNFIFFEPSTYTSKRVSVLQQGFVPAQNHDSILIPHYPMYDDEQIQWENNCPYGLSLLVGDAVTSPTLSFEVEGKAYGEDIDYVRDTTITPNGNSFTYISNIGNVGDYRDLTPTSDGVIKLTDRLWVIDTVSPDGIFDGTRCFVRYPQADRLSTYTYHYAFAYLEDCDNMTPDEVTPSMLNNVDGTYIIYAETTTPDTFDALYTAEERIYVVGDDSNYVQNYEYKVAILDLNPKRYYLFWQDRYGSFQCQPFNCTADYSENFDRTEIQDYQNRRRNANVQIQSKWKIHSGWIEENLYPYYESIYTSPLVILYDTAYDERYTVLVSGNYEEKTYKNQKRLINMQLELTENKKQNIIY